MPPGRRRARRRGVLWAAGLVAAAAVGTGPGARAANPVHKTLFRVAGLGGGFKPATVTDGDHRLPLKPGHTRFVREKASAIREYLRSEQFFTSSLDGPVKEFSQTLVHTVRVLEMSEGKFKVPEARPPGTSGSFSVPSNGGDRARQRETAQRASDAFTQKSVDSASGVVACEVCEYLADSVWGYVGQAQAVPDPERFGMFLQSTCRGRIVTAVLQKYAVVNVTDSRVLSSLEAYSLEPRSTVHGAISMFEITAVKNACKYITAQKSAHLQRYVSEHEGAITAGAGKHPSDRARFSRAACMECGLCEKEINFAEALLRDFGNRCKYVPDEGGGLFEVCWWETVRFVRMKNNQVVNNFLLGHFNRDRSGRIDPKAPGGAPLQALQSADLLEGMTMEQVGKAEMMLFDRGPACGEAGGAAVANQRTTTQINHICSPDGKTHATIRMPLRCHYLINLYMPSLCALDGIGLGGAAPAEAEAEDRPKPKADEPKAEL